MTGTTTGGKEEEHKESIEQLLSTPLARRLAGVDDWE